MTTLIPLDYDDTDRPLTSIDELRAQVAAFLATFDGEWDNLRYTDDPASINYEAVRSIWDSATWHYWQDGLYIATLRAIASGVDDPAAWAAEVLKVAEKDDDFTRWYE